MKNYKQISKTLSVPERHQLKIARATLRMVDIGPDILGGPTHEEAREIIQRLTKKRKKTKRKPI
jgi:hypothetical protein